MTKTDAAGHEVSVFVDAGKLAGSAHRSVACASCHSEVTETHPDGTPAKPPTCVGCHGHEARPDHELAAGQYAASVHGMSQRAGAAGAATCWDCHGAHDIVSPRRPESPAFKLNLPQTCAKCHSDPRRTGDRGMGTPTAAAQYKDSIHGRALLQMGLIVAPSCADCHGVHDLKRAAAPDSPINKANVARTCGKCHVGIEQTYDKSVHGQLLAKGDRRGPVCTDCHTAHGVEAPRDGHFKLASDARCGKCHEDRLAHYRETYHGKAMALGKPNVAAAVAACYDCHGHHDVLPPANPESRLSAANILGTCRRCHAGAPPKFTGYRPHANPLDRKNYPVLHAVFLGMTGLLVGVFGFFGLHTIAWLVGAAYLSRRDADQAPAAEWRAARDDAWYTRFAPSERFLHFLLVTGFLLLVVTGMPLKFYYTGWAKAVFGLIGGPETARSLHHFGAVTTFLCFGLHLASLVAKAWRGRHRLRDPGAGRGGWGRLWEVMFGPDSMIPTAQDWRDFVAHCKWFCGKGDRPTFDRWTYWEKFDYLAVFWGVAIIGASGLILWFPAFFTNWLPGWVINIAAMIHSDEALLAAGFIFAIHFFNTHFRIGKFPMDTSIFSGRISETEMRRERQRWYDRLVATGRLEEFRVKDEWEQWKRIAQSFGYLFFGLGVLLLILIIYAMVVRLTH